MKTSAVLLKICAAGSLRVILSEHRFSLVFSLTSIHFTAHYLACPNLVSYHLGMTEWFMRFLLASNFNGSQRKDHLISVPDGTALSFSSIPEG